MKTRVYNPPEDSPNRNVDEVAIPALGKAVKLGESFVLTDEQDAALGDDPRFPYADPPKPDTPAPAAAKPYSPPAPPVAD